MSDTIDFTDTPKPPEGYVEQDGCWNCKTVLDMSDPEGDMFYCTCAAKPKPAHPGVPRDYTTYEEYEKVSDIWTEWIMTLPSVLRNGKCPKW